MLTTPTPPQPDLSAYTTPLEQPKGTARIVAIMPAYNEERFIGSVVLKSLQYVERVIVVDDGSSDATAAIAKAAGATVIVHECNQGKGGALNTGFREVQNLDADVVVLIDADGQHLPDEIPLVVGPILSGQADICIGSRYIEKTSEVPTHRVYGHRVFNLITSTAAGVRASDSQSGFRAFSIQAVQQIVFSSAGFSVESEMQFLAHDHKFRVAEVPITILYHEKPKRNVVHHGLHVLNGILWLVGQYRPLLFFGVSGVVIALLGGLGGLYTAFLYGERGELAVGYALISIAVILIGIFTFFTGIMLHSIRGIMLELAAKSRSR